MCPVIDPKMRHLQEKIGFFGKNSVIFKSACFNKSKSKSSRGMSANDA